MTRKKNLYFASDFHLGAPDYQTSRERENRIIRWLEYIESDAAEIYFVGDVFDFWFEYKTVIPKGYIRLLGKLAALSDGGTKLSFFRGNHDMWMFNYLKKELSAEIISNELIINRGSKRFYIHHGDGLGDSDHRYKVLKKIFRSSFCQSLFSGIHPDLGMRIAHYWSRKSRLSSGEKESFQGMDKEWLILYSQALLQNEHFDFFIYGHRHLPLNIPLSPHSRYINLGEWFNYNSYAVFNGEDLILNYFNDQETV